MKTMEGYSNIFIVNHPLVQHKLTIMRDKNTCHRDFRALLKEISWFIGYEATANMKLTTRPVSTPIKDLSDAPTLEVEKPIIVPILRAGLFMADGMLDLLPCARVGHLGMRRDHDTHMPIEYLVKLPEYNGEPVFLVDPMFATGGSAVAAIDTLVRNGIPADKITFIALVGAPEAVKRFNESYPNVPVYIGSIDEKLDENAYIVPGLGDAGDRLFGTD